VVAYNIPMKLLLHASAASQIDNLVDHPGGTVLLHGIAGVGKYATAREVARRLNCEGCTDASCRSCKMLASGNHPDVVVLRPDDKNKIGIESVHELQHTLHYGQYESASQRVIIIDSADRLTLPAQSALLKTLEEPPAGTTILLTAPSPSTLLPTVVSRCTLLYLPPVSDGQIADFIATAHPGVNAASIAALSHGVPGRAVVYATNPEQATADQVMAQEVESLLQTGGLFERLQVAARMVAAADQRERYLAELVTQARSSARAAQNPDALDAVEHLLQRLRANVNPKTAFEALAVELG